MPRSTEPPADLGRTNVGGLPRVAWVLVIAGLISVCVQAFAKAPNDSARLRPFYEQKIAWSDCYQGMECAALSVPFDYAAAGGEKIEIAVVRRPVGPRSPRRVPEWMWLLWLAMPALETVFANGSTSLGSTPRCRSQHRDRLPVRCREGRGLPSRPNAGRSGRVAGVVGLRASRRGSVPSQ